MALEKKLVPGQISRRTTSCGIDCTSCLRATCETTFSCSFSKPFKYQLLLDWQSTICTTSNLEKKRLHCFSLKSPTLVEVQNHSDENLNCLQQHHLLFTDCFLSVEVLPSWFSIAGFAKLLQWKDDQTLYNCSWSLFSTAPPNLPTGKNWTNFVKEDVPSDRGGLLKIERRTSNYILTKPARKICKFKTETDWDKCILKRVGLFCWIGEIIPNVLMLLKAVSHYNCSVTRVHSKDLM